MEDTFFFPKLSWYLLTHTTLDGGVVKGYMEIPLFECAVEMQLCPQNSVNWWGNLHLPTKACKFWFILMAIVLQSH